jgi:RNA polymerase sigma-70 factor (ECF subfamily)
VTEEPDAELLRRFVHGDRDAFESLFHRFEGDVHNWVRRIVRDGSSAEDVVVDTFWRAYRARARFDWSRSVGAWLRRIATNAALDHLRASRRVERRPADERTLASASVDYALKDAIARAFDHLSPKLKAVATLAIIEEVSHAEIAEALGVPIGTVKSRLHRAMRALRVELRRLGVEP